MKKAKGKTIVGIGFALSLMFACNAFLAACGPGTVEYDPNNFLTEEMAEAEYGNKYRIVRDPVTISICVPKHSLHSNYKDMKVFQVLSRITNLKFDFNEIDYEAYSDKKPLMWEDASALPDCFMFCNSLEEQVLYSSLGAIAPLDDLIDQYCPNYKALMGEYKEIAQTSTLTDGHIYSFCSVDRQGSTCYQYVNNQWLTDLYNDGVIDFTMPSTVEEYKEMLTAFKNNDPNHNGKADEIPLCTKFNYTSIYLLSAFGHVTKSAEITDDGDFIFVPQTEEYKEYVKYAKSLYDEKLINQNLYEITDGDVANYGAQGIVGTSENVAAYLLVGDELAKDYVTIPPLTSDYSPTDESGNKKTYHICFSSFDPTELIITSKSVYKREIARLTDILYSDFGVSLFLAGEEGVDWEYDDDTRTTWHTTYPDNVDNETYRGSITPNVGLGAFFYKSEEWTSGQTNELVKQLNQDRSVYESSYKEALPPLVFTSEESEELAYVKLELDSYVATTEADFITGKKNVDSYWNTFQSTIKKIGVEKLLKIYRDAYARSVSRG